MRTVIFIRWCVPPFVGPSVCQSFRSSVRPFVTHKLNFQKWAEFERECTRNMKLCNLEDDSGTGTQAHRLNAFDV